VKLIRSVLLALLALSVIAVVGRAVFQTQTISRGPVDKFLPEGALLSIQSRDFAGLLQDWNNSPEKAQWLKSDNYRVFSNSRLFLRLSKAQAEFAKAAGVPPDSALLNDAAGAESALAIYDIGKLEFLYVTRLNNGRFVQSPLWQSRGKFEARNAGGQQFFVRKDQESERVAAFAIANDYLVLGTREDLVAGSIELIAGGKGRALTVEPWYALALAAAPRDPGDLRMALHLEKIAVTPHFRTYWIQQNITEMQGYGAAVCDLYREGATYREERVILPKRAMEDDAALAQQNQAITGLLAAVPQRYGFYRAAPTNVKDSLSMVEQKILAPQFTAASAEKIAPVVQLSGGQTGSASDLEIRIDAEPAPDTASKDPRQSLQKQFERAGPIAALVVHASRRNSDGTLVQLPVVVVLSAAGDWDMVALQAAMQEYVAPNITASRQGMDWQEQKEAGGYFELNGLLPIKMGRRGKLLYLGNDESLFKAVLLSQSSAPAQPVSYASAFNHDTERLNYYDLTKLVDRGANIASQEPAFFSRNITSLSKTFAGVQREEIVSRQTKDKIVQTVTYRWAQ
jgi:hypothetical protein